MITLKKISKEFVTETGFKKIILKDISFQILPEKIISIIAAKDSGLTTLLKIISNLESASSGEIVSESGGKVIYLPIEPSSFPWLNVFDNTVFCLKDYSKIEIDRLIKLVGLEGYEKFHPHRDSLGFRFRISLARSLAHKPRFILVDDCFSNMDQLTKNEMYNLIKLINESEKVAFLVATSNITEALLLSDKIYLMKQYPGEVVTQFDVRKFDTPEMDSAEFISWRIQIENTLKKISSQSLNSVSI